MRLDIILLTTNFIILTVIYLTMTIYILTMIGLLISFYGVYFTKRKKSSANFKPFCDFSDKVSCTKAFESKGGALFGVKNYVMGIFFYVAMFMLVLGNLHIFAVFLSMASLFMSMYLASILVTEVRSFCVICVSTYVVNILIFLFLVIK